jgi:diguanylate cyclase (GGDEF)-like protein
VLLADKVRVTVPAAWLECDDAIASPDQVSYDADAASSVLPVACGLLAVYVAMLVLHPLVMGQPSGTVTTAVTVVAAVMSAGIALRAWRAGIPGGWGHPLLGIFTALTTAAGTAHIVESGDAQESVAFVLLAVAVGAVMLRAAWFLVGVAIVWLGWITSVLVMDQTARTWVPWGFYLAVASVLGVVVHLLRRRSLDIAGEALEMAVRAATEDAATGLSNRRGLALLANELVAIGRRSSDAVHCSFLDVDGLKKVNDRYGHEAGDHVILAVAEAIRATSRETDVVARWGGDEFVVVGLGVGIAPLELEARVSAYVAHHHPGDLALAHITISVGRSMIEPWDSGDLERLLWLADKDMYVRRAMTGRTVPPVVTLDRTDRRPE